MKKRKLTSEEAAECAALKRVWLERHKGLNLTQAKAGQLLGMSGPAASYYLNGVNVLNAKVAAGFARLLRVSVEDFSPRLAREIDNLSMPTLEAGPEITRPFRRANIIGTAQLGPDGYWDALGEADGFIEIPTTDPDAYALRVRGDSMSPAIRSGWVVWCEPSHPLIPGEYVMVRLANGASMVKELLYESADEVSLMALNDHYGRTTIHRSEIEQIHYVGGVVAPSKIKL